MARLLKRYTSLASALDVLAKQRFALLDPSTWKDKNDCRFLEAYKNHSNLKRIYAVCMTYAAETYHHWEVFARHNEGVCIEFHEQNFRSLFPNTGDYKFGDVKYYSVSQINEMGFISSDHLPFMKGDGYEPEKECRLIYGSMHGDGIVHYIPCPIESINRIIINPWIPHALVGGVRDAIKNASRGTPPKIFASRLVDDEQWAAAVRRVNDYESMLR